MNYFKAGSQRAIFSAGRRPLPNRWSGEFKFSESVSRFLGLVHARGSTGSLYRPFLCAWSQGADDPVLWAINFPLLRKHTIEVLCCIAAEKSKVAFQCFWQHNLRQNSSKQQQNLITGSSAFGYTSASGEEIHIVSKILITWLYSNVHTCITWLHSNVHTCIRFRSHIYNNWKIVKCVRFLMLPY